MFASGADAGSAGGRHEPDDGHRLGVDDLHAGVTGHVNDAGAVPRRQCGLVPLTRREVEVATMAARGMSDHDIASTLVISVRTVESHLAAAYRKLGINSRRELRSALRPVLGVGALSST